MSGKLIINGKEYAVSAKFQAEVLDSHLDLAEMAHSDLVRRRDEILRLADRRNAYIEAIPDGQEIDPSGNLTVAEAQRLANIVHVLNCHQAINFLRGRGHREFGFDGVDQVHGNSHQAPCGCVINTVFDHHRRAESDNPHHPHYPKKSCNGHKHLMDDFRAHHAAVRADSAAKE